MRKRTVAAGISLAGVVACLVTAPGAASAAGAHGIRPLRECATPSIDRLQQWLATGEGTTVPATGSLLVPARRGPGYAAEVAFRNAEWHVVVVWLANLFEAQADLSRSAGFWLTSARPTTCTCSFGRPRTGAAVHSGSRRCRPRTGAW